MITPYTREDGDWNGTCPDALNPALYDQNRFHRICVMVRNGEMPGKRG